MMHDRIIEIDTTKSGIPTLDLLNGRIRNLDALEFEPHLLGKQALVFLPEDRKAYRATNNWRGRYIWGKVYLIVCDDVWQIVESAASVIENVSFNPHSGTLDAQA